jgi:hypothetical protein
LTTAIICATQGYSQICFADRNYYYYSFLILINKASRSNQQKLDGEGDPNIQITLIKYSTTARAKHRMQQHTNHSQKLRNKTRINSTKMQRFESKISRMMRWCSPSLYCAALYFFTVTCEFLRCVVKINGQDFRRSKSLVTCLHREI